MAFRSSRAHHGACVVLEHLDKTVLKDGSQMLADLMFVTRVPGDSDYDGWHQDLCVGHFTHGCDGKRVLDSLGNMRGAGDAPRPMEYAVDTRIHRPRNSKPNLTL